MKSKSTTNARKWREMPDWNQSFSLEKDCFQSAILLHFQAFIVCYAFSELNFRFLSINKKGQRKISMWGKYSKVCKESIHIVLSLTLPWPQNNIVPPLMMATPTTDEDDQRWRWELRLYLVSFRRCKFKVSAFCLPRFALLDCCQKLLPQNMLITSFHFQRLLLASS